MNGDWSAFLQRANWTISHSAIWPCEETITKEKGQAVYSHTRPYFDTGKISRNRPSTFARSVRGLFFRAKTKLGGKKKFQFPLKHAVHPLFSHQTQKNGRFSCWTGTFWKECFSLVKELLRNYSLFVLLFFLRVKVISLLFFFSSYLGGLILITSSYLAFISLLGEMYAQCFFFILARVFHLVVRKFYEI